MRESLPPAGGEAYGHRDGAPDLRRQSRSEITRLIRCCREARLPEDREQAMHHLVPVVYEELRELARSHLRRERANHTLQPTALVNEAYLRVVDQHAADWRDRSHFFALAARLMRQILIDHARRRAAAKRGGDRRRVTLADVAHPERADVDLLALDEALEAFAALDARKAKVVELRYFGGLTMEEVAEALGVSLRTAESDWFLARAWLRTRLGGA
jgi:RNA polymerase sigma factor (TIGR02999 family)